MSEKIKEVYDADPTAGNDPTTNWLLPSDDNANTPITLDISQLSSAVSEQLGLNPQAPFNQFSVSIQDNTLTANIAPISGITYTHHIILVDDSSTPTPVVGFTQGPVVLTKALAGWAAETWYLWIYDSVTTTLTQLTDVNGTAGVVVVPNDNIIDEGVTDLVLAAGANPPTQVSVTFNTGDDTGTGVAQYDLMRTIEDPDITNPDQHIVVSDGISQGTTFVNGFIPIDENNEAVTLSLWVRVTDVAGNVSVPTQSNTETIALGTPPAITSVTLTDTTNGSTILPMAIVDDVSIDNWVVSVDDSTRPTPDSTSWTAIEPTSVDVGTLGSHTVYVWGRDFSWPTGISATASDTGIASDVPGGTTEAGFTDLTVSVAERYSPTLQVTIDRSGDVSGASTITITSEDTTNTNISNAIAGTNYLAVNELVSFSASDTQKTVNIPIYYRDLGHSDVGFDLVLSGETGIDTVTNSRLQVSILGNHGYWDTGDIDVTSEASLPQNLPVIGSQTAGSSTTISGKYIDAAGSAYGVRISDLANNVTIENCVITNFARQGVYAVKADNVTIRNCFFIGGDPYGLRSYQMDITINEGYCIKAESAGTTDTDTFKVLGCNGRNGTGFLNFHQIEQSTGIEVKNNFYQDPYRVGRELLGGQTAGQGQFLFFTNSDGMVQPLIYNNISLKDITDTSVTADGDHMNTFTSGCANGSSGLWRYNYCHGIHPNTSSGTGMLMGDNSQGLADGNNDVFYNIMSGTGTTCYSLMGGQNQRAKYNDGYSPYNVPYITRPGTSVGVSLQRSRRCIRGNFQSATFAYNRLLYYSGFTTGIRQNTYYNPTTGADGYAPNHGTCTTCDGLLSTDPNFDPTVGTPAETNITGFDGTNTSIIMDSANTSHAMNPSGENWDTSVPLTGISKGDDWVRGRYQPGNQPAVDEGMRIWYYSYNCPVGNGAITYNATANTLAFAAYGETAGTAKDVSSQEWGDSDNESFHLFSQNGAYVRVIANHATLDAGGNKAWTVNNSGATFEDYPIYPGSTGDWTGSGGVTPPSGNEPTLPVITDPIATVTDSSITVVWSASTGTPSIGGYNLYASGGAFSNTLVATTTSTSYQHTGLAQATTYTYQVEAFDTATPVRFSGLSSPVSATTTTAAGEELLNAEFTSNSTEPNELIGWDANNATPSPITPTNGTEFEVVGDGGGTPSLYQEVTGLTPASTYKLTVGHKLGVSTPIANNTTGKVVTHTSTARPWTTDTGVAEVLSGSNSSTYTEYVYTGIAPSGTGVLHIALWTNSSDSGDSTWWDYCRLVEE